MGNEQNKWERWLALTSRRLEALHGMEYCEAQQGWLDSLSDKEYAELARAFFELNKHDEHNQAFLKDTQSAFELATKRSRIDG